MTWTLIQHHKRMLIALSVLILIAYIALNIWFFTRLQTQTKPGSGTMGLPANQSGQTTQPPLPTQRPPPTPTPRPIGPGRYACDPNGFCNDYGDEQRKSCPVTFADRYCLDSCGDKSRWCSE